jgi:hypothetical protein
MIEEIARRDNGNSGSDLINGFSEFLTFLEAGPGALVTDPSLAYTFQPHAEFLRTMVYRLYSLPLFKARMISLVKDLTSFPECNKFPQTSGDPIDSLNDPLYGLLTALNNYCDYPNYHRPAGIGSDIIVIPVAASGNDDEVRYPYFPALWPNVISVSAEYSDLANCPSQSDGQQAVEVLRDDMIIKDIESRFAQMHPSPPQIDESDLSPVPSSNPGEIKMNGVSYVYERFNPPWYFPYTPVFTCIWGTSFAAPRLSLEMALFLMWDDVSSCRSPARNVSTIPLHYEGWLNRTRDQLVSNFCDLFADNFGNFFDTSIYPDFTNDIVFP